MLLLATAWHYSFMGSCMLPEAEVLTGNPHITMEDDINYRPKCFSPLCTRILYHAKFEGLSTEGSILFHPLTWGFALELVLASGMCLSRGAYFCHLSEKGFPQGSCHSLTWALA